MSKRAQDPAMASPSAPPAGAIPLAFFCRCHPDIPDAMIAMLHHLGFETKTSERGILYRRSEPSDWCGELKTFGSISSWSFEHKEGWGDGPNNEPLHVNIAKGSPWQPDKSVPETARLAFAMAWGALRGKLKFGGVALWGRHGSALADGRIIPFDAFPEVHDEGMGKGQIQLMDGTVIYGAHVVRLDIQEPPSAKKTAAGVSSAERALRKLIDSDPTRKVVKRQKFIELAKGLGSSARGASTVWTQVLSSYPPEISNLYTSAGAPTKKSSRL